MDISLISDVLFSPWGFPITNSVLAFWVIILLILGFVLLVRYRLAVVPNRLQTAAESLVVYVHDVVFQQLRSKKLAKWFTPYMVALFLIVLLANQFSILPLVQSVVVGEEPLTFLFRTPTSDLTLPFLMALLVILSVQIICFVSSPLGHIGNYIKIKPLLKAKGGMEFFTALIEFFLGFLDIIGEFAKVVSLSCRLFGNIFAGELMVIIISSLAWWSTYLVPIPFFVISIFSGVVQTFVFVLLSLGFMSATLSGIESEA